MLDFGMKAAVYTKYGPPEVVVIKEVPKPIPSGNQVLVRVYASTVNRTDSGFRSAEYFISRFWSGLFRPKIQILGSEFSGIIESIGDKVTQFKIGDKVFGYNEKTFGGHAEYLLIDERDSIAEMPKGMNFKEAAPLLEGSHYALNDIRVAKVAKGHHVLVYGATGAIGSAAVQLLKHFGAIVTAVGNTKNVVLLKKLGADVVVDYQTQDFETIKGNFDFIFDAVGKISFGQSKPILNKKGIYISTELGKNGENIFLALLTPIFSNKKVLFPIPTIDKADVLFIKKLVESGAFMPVIDRTYELNEIVEAYRYVQTGQKTGNVVLNIRKE